MRVLTLSWPLSSLWAHRRTSGRKSEDTYQLTSSSSAVQDADEAALTYDAGEPVDGIFGGLHCWMELSI